MPTEVWTDLADYPRLEAFAPVVGNVLVRDSTTHVLLRPFKDSKGTLYFRFKAGREEVTLPMSAIRALVPELDGSLPPATPEADEVVTEPEVVEQTLAERIATVQAAAANAHLSQKELASVLGTTVYQIRKALKG